MQNAYSILHNNFAFLFQYKGTQNIVEYPEDTKDFMSNMIQPETDAGDVIIFTGVMQHCAMPNKSGSSRTVILIQMLPKVT